MSFSRLGVSLLCVDFGERVFQILLEDVELLRATNRFRPGLTLDCIRDDKERRAIDAGGLGVVKVGLGLGFVFIVVKTIIEVGHVKPDVLRDRKSTRLNSSHIQKSRMPSSA